MLVIRDSQLKLLTERSCEQWLVQHVKRCFPDFARRFEKRKLSDWVRENRSAAARYFRTEPGVSLYIDLLCLLGEDFVENPRLSWAREILTNPMLDEAQRRSRLYSKARSYLLGPVPQGRIRRSA